ncbi:hypothetical protein ACR776_01195 [Sphingobacterium spiritivorum]|uniref:hypothetical protein n=1 Tax=Sphingobacterium spiritivorum TaxID=258 RepID=UPI003DA5AC70
MKHEIPIQQTGRSMDASESICFPEKVDAKDFYEIVRNRLLRIDKWYALAELPMASFIQIDQNGQETTDLPKVGNFIKIDIPGPGLSSTRGFDFVRIERIDETDEDNLQTLTLTLRPSTDPIDQSDNEIKHFFKDIATSTLQIQRINNSINVNYFGRNELMNLDVEALTDKLRNFFVGMGARLGASFPQWKLLLKGLVNSNIIQGNRNKPL